MWMCTRIHVLVQYKKSQFFFMQIAYETKVMKFQDPSI